MKKPHTHSRRRPFWKRAWSLLLAERRRAGISFTVGLIVLFLVQLPAVEQSFLGGPDRQMMETAFKLRADVIGGTADPVLFLDFDDRTMNRLNGGPSFAPPPATVPRATLGQLLDFFRKAPAQGAPRVVLMDVDLAQPASDGPAGVEQLHAALEAWSKDATAPPLILARETLPASAMGRDGAVPALPDTPYDDVVRPAGNIYWATARVLGDQNGVIREFAPYECAQASNGVATLYSAALLAFFVSQKNPAALDGTPARRWVDNAPGQCQSNPGAPLQHGERIDYHLSLDQQFADRVWPRLDPAWPGFAACGRKDPAIFRRLSIADIVDALKAGGDVSGELLCQRIVIIGGTSAMGGDFVQTPLNEMNGSVVLANAVRGLQLTHGGLRPIPLLFQVLLLLAVSVSMSLASLATTQARRRYQKMKANAEHLTVLQRMSILPLHPLVLNTTIALVAHFLGVGLLAISLNYGLWGFLSAPTFAAAFTETIQELADE